jgi:two-component system, LytTR family, response regulator
MPIKTVFIEDEEANRIALRGLLDLYCPDVEIVAEAVNVADGYAAICKHRPQLALIDIRLEDRTVFDLLAKFEKIDFQIIILTAYPEFEYAQQAIHYGVKEYLLKPCKIEDLHRAIAKIQANITAPGTIAPPRVLLLPSNHGQTVIRTETIALLEADGPYTNIYLANQEKFMVSKNLKYFEEILGYPPFFRTHDSAIVNFDHINTFLRDGQVGQVSLSGGRQAPISARRMSDFTERFKAFAEGR